VLASVAWPALAQQKTDRATLIAKINKLGGKVIVDDKSPGKPVVGVDLCGTVIANAGMKHLQGLLRLEDLDLQSTKTGDAGLKHLANPTNLRTLTLNKTQITAAGWLPSRDSRSWKN
jgi:hypothetical protein